MALAALLAAVTSVLTRFVVLTPAQACIVALWVAHCHALDAFEVTPYLHIYGATKRTGKTRLLEVLSLLVPRAWFTGRVTAAALVRKIHQECSTLLLDESDTAFGQRTDYSDALRNVMNGGYKRSGRYTVCVGSGAALAVRDFFIFGAKAIAGIGGLPDTIADRSIPIILKRRKFEEEIGRFREREVRQVTDPIRLELEQWALAARDALSRSAPYVPRLGSDRLEEVVEPLLAIADAAGEDWAQRAREAIVALAPPPVLDEDMGVRLLSDLRVVFRTAQDPEALPTRYILTQLCRIDEAPWAEFGERPLSAKKLAELLARFGVHTAGVLDFEGRKMRGYRRHSFEDAWLRYPEV